MRGLLAIALLAACGGPAGDGSDGGMPDLAGLPGGGDGGGDLASAPPAPICAAPIQPADVSAPSTVVGSGTAASCSESALAAALAKGGVVTFNCGAQPATITVTQTIALPTDRDTVIDGGGAVRILDWNSANYRANKHTLTLQHLALSHGHARGATAYAPAPAPCSSGFYDGSGGALNSELDVYDSVFEQNSALGFGANGDDASKCSVLATNGQHQTGSGGNGGAIAIDGGSDGTHTFCGDVFRGNVGGMMALGGALFRTPDGARQVTAIDRCLFESNQGDSGGAAYFHNSTLTITASTFHANAGAGVGTIQADGTTFDFTNVTFAGNHSTGGVGATLALFSGDGTLTNCTFASNVCDAANMFGAAIFGSPNLTIQNTIFDGNFAQNAGAPMQCQVGTVTGSGDLQWPKNRAVGGSADALCAPGIDEEDPLLGAIGDHGGPVPTMVPSVGSPALGRGMSCPATDARGMTRPASGCTAGAVEGSS